MPRRVSIKQMEKAKDSNVKVYTMEEAQFTEGSRIEEVFKDNKGQQENSKEDAKGSSNGAQVEGRIEKYILLWNRVIAVRKLKDMLCW